MEAKLESLQNSQGQAIDTKLVELERSFRGVIEKLTQAVAQHKKETDGSFLKAENELNQLRDLITDTKLKSMEQTQRSLKDFEGRLKLT